MTAPSHESIQELLGAYALDAVVGEESEAVELHLRECPRCRATVGEFRETASLLASGHAPAPVRTWDAILAGIEGADAPKLSLERVTPLRPRWSRRVGVALGAAAALLIGVLGVQVANQAREIRDTRASVGSGTVLSAALAAQGNPESRRAELRTSNGRLLARVVITPDGTGFLWADGLPRLADDRTYQLWAVNGTERISVGVLGSRPEVAPFRVAADVIGLAITEEGAGGVVATRNQPTASGLVVS